jgi:tRNA pseudouridine38-40 synthase
MVRNIAGVLMAIGRGDRPESWAAEVLALRNRALGGITAPPDGLYLVGVEYPREFGLPDWQLRPVPTWREGGVH